MKRILTTLGLVLLLFLSACSYFLSGESYELYLLEGDVIYLDDGGSEIESIILDNENASVIDNKFISVEKEGITIGNINYIQKEKDEIKLNISPRTLKPIDVKENKKIKEEIYSKINDFTKKISLSNYLSFDLNAYLEVSNEGKEISSSVMNSRAKMRANPLYLEFNGYQKEDDLVIIQKEKDKYYQYFLYDENTYYKMNYAEDDHNFKLSYDASIYYFDAEGMLDFVFDCEKGNAYKSENYYIFNARYEDCLNEDMKEAIRKQYQGSGLDASELMDAITTTYYKFEKDKVVLGLSTQQQINGIDITISIAYVITTKGFTPITLDKSNTIGEYFKDIDEVDEEIVLVGNKYTLTAPDGEKEYVLTTLDKGQYLFSNIADEQRQISATIAIYDSNKERVEIYYDEEEYPTTPNTFYISEKGKYYIEMTRTNGDRETITLEKVKFNTIADKENPLELKSGKYTSEGFMDLNYFEYNNTSDKKVIVYIKNSGENDFIITHPSSDKWSVGKHKIDFIYSGIEMGFILKPGINKFIIFDMYKDTEYKKVDFEIEVRFQEKEVVGGTSIDDPNITFMDPTYQYSLGPEGEELWLKIEIKEKGKLKFNVTKHLSIVVYDANKEQLRIGKGGFTVEPGIYYVGISRAVLYPETLFYIEPVVTKEE